MHSFCITTTYNFNCNTLLLYIDWLASGPYQYHMYKTLQANIVTRVTFDRSSCSSRLLVLSYNRHNIHMQSVSKFVIPVIIVIIVVEYLFTLQLESEQSALVQCMAAGQAQSQS